MGEYCVGIVCGIGFSAAVVAVLECVDDGSSKPMETRKLTKTN
jgi:hypothetical protein